MCFTPSLSGESTEAMNELVTYTTATPEACCLSPPFLQLSAQTGPCLLGGSATSHTLRIRPTLHDSHEIPAYRSDF